MGPAASIKRQGFRARRIGVYAVQINLEEQQILELQATYSAEQVYGLALSKRVEAFGQVARLLQRPKPDDIEITTNQKR